MQAVSGKIELLRALAKYGAIDSGARWFRTGSIFDELLPDTGLRCGAVHELLFEATSPAPRTPALLLARAAQTVSKGLLLWSDPQRLLTPQALRPSGIDLRRLVLLRPKNVVDEIAAVTECLRCRAVAAVVADVRHLTSLQARRFQLAAEQGSGAGILMRPHDRRAIHYAAATRWLIKPAPGSDQAQRWSVTLLHGHGGQVGSTVLLEVSREGSVYPPVPISDRSTQTPATPARTTHRAIA